MFQGQLLVYSALQDIMAQSLEPPTHCHAFYANQEHILILECQCVYSVIWEPITLHMALPRVPHAIWAHITRGLG